MFRIRTLNEIAPTGLDLFAQGDYEVAEEISSPDAILLRSYKLSFSEIENSVLAVARAGAGVNNIPVNDCTNHGVVVFNTPGANANSVKELVIAGLLLSSRGISEGMQWVASQRADDKLGLNIEKEKNRFVGNEISGKKLGVIGLGSIGALVANAAVNLDMDVYGYDPFISVQAAWGLSSAVKRCESLDQLLNLVDYATLHIPFTLETKHLINAERLKKARQELRILNFSRGELVDSSAMKTALSSGQINRYVTDFPDETLHGVRAVMSIPHLGASTVEAKENCAVMTVKQVKDYLENGNITNSVNFPNCSLEPSGGVRVLIANNNIPNMLSQILSVLAKEGMNVDDMVNRHRDGIAYTIIDLSADALNNECITRLRSINGVLMARQICP